MNKTIRRDVLQMLNRGRGPSRTCKGMSVAGGTKVTPAAGNNNTQQNPNTLSVAPIGVL